MAAPSTVHAPYNAYKPIRVQLKELQPLGVLVFGGRHTPPRSWFWAWANANGRKFAYHKMDNGQVAILRLR